MTDRIKRQNKDMILIKDLMKPPGHFYALDPEKLENPGLWKDCVGIALPFPPFLKTEKSQG